MNKPTLTNCSFQISTFGQVKEKVLNWAKQFDTFCFLDNHQYQAGTHSIECLLAAGVQRSIRADAGTALDQLELFKNEKNSWLFGHLGYDLKFETEKLVSTNPDLLQFPDLFFFEPETLIRFDENQIHILAEAPGQIFSEIQNTEVPALIPAPVKTDIRSRFSREEYMSVLSDLKQHILRGDCYEINFCQEFYAEDCLIDPLDVYKKLSTVSPNPFSALYRMNDQWLICASPERYLKKEGKHIMSQPIKGTSKRNHASEEESKKKLFESEKDRSENVMVVDLVRNDLSRVCEQGSVKVDELFGVYAFPQVYQMISTVSGELKPGVSFSDIVKASFPMGSMTGAPKKKVMELIEKYENRKRGIFSGALGYITPNGDFDFNVVIRSIMYDAGSRYLSYQVGSGITFYSDLGKEWEECMLKAAAIKEVLGN